MPISNTPTARKAALELARQMALERAGISHCPQQSSEGFTYLIVYGCCVHTLDCAAINFSEDEVTYLNDWEIKDLAARTIQRPVVVVGASAGTDAHSVGLGAILPGDLARVPQARIAR